MALPKRTPEQRQFLRKYIYGDDPDGRENSEFGERAAQIGNYRTALEDRIREVAAGDEALAQQLRSQLQQSDLTGLPGRGDTPYVAILHPSVNTLEEAAGKISGSGMPVTPEQLAAAALRTYGGTQEAANAQMFAQARRNYSLSEPTIQVVNKGGQRLALGIGQELMSETPSPQLYELIGVDEAMLRQRYGAQPVTDAAGTGAPAAQGVVDPAAQGVAAPPVAVPPPAPAPTTASGADSWFPSWLPRHSGVGDLESAMAYGAAATGGLALAGYLMGMGRPQQSTADYNSAAAAMNSY